MTRVDIRRAVAAVAIGYILIYILPLGVRPLTTPDETRYAEIAREMLRGGDWTVPRLTGLRYFEKPPMGYWTGATVMGVFGENAFAARLPSALAAGITALLIFRFVSAFAGGRRDAILAVAILLSFLMVFAIGVTNVLDSQLSMFLTAAAVFFYSAHVAGTRRQRLLYLSLFGLACGCGFLTKGLIALAVPTVTVVPFLLWEKRWRDLLSAPWLPMLCAALVALPWSLSIHAREPDFWNYFFWVEHIKRFASQDAQHGKPFWYFAPVLFAGALPWSALLPAAVKGLAQTRPVPSPVRYAICWCLFPFLFFSASHGKLATYILPCFPPLAILAAVGLVKYMRQDGQRLFSAGALFSSVLAGLLVTVLVVGQATGLAGLRLFSPSETWKWTVAVLALGVWVALALMALRSGSAGRKLALFCAASMVFMFCVHFVFADAFKDEKAPLAFFDQEARRVPPGAVLVSDGHRSPAVCWHFKREDVYVLSYSSELTYGLGYEDAKHRFLDFSQFAGLVADKNRSSPIVLILTRKRYEQFRPNLPPPRVEASGDGFVLARY